MSTFSLLSSIFYAGLCLIVLLIIIGTMELLDNHPYLKALFCIGLIWIMFTLIIYLDVYKG